jgi:hypothetical protein
MSIMSKERMEKAQEQLKTILKKITLRLRPSRGWSDLYAASSSRLPMIME